MHDEQNRLTKTILRRIEEEHMMPKPRWQFMLRNVAWWSLWMIVLFSGACVAAAMAFVLSNAEWQYRFITHGTTFNFLLDALPVLWIVLLTAAVILGYENIRKTKLGYRYPMMTVVMLTLVGTVVGGLLLHAVGFGESVERSIGDRIPRYRPAIIRNRDRWMNPAHGFLAGEITDRAADRSSVSLRSFDGRVWILPTADLTPRGKDILARFDEVRLVGLPVPFADTTGTPLFHPCFAFPWDERHDLFSPPHRPPHALPPPPERFFDSGSTTSCQGIPSFPSLRGIQDRQTP